MRIINILFNHKKSAADNKTGGQIAGVEQCFVDYSKLFTTHDHQVLSILKPDMLYKDKLLEVGSEIYEINVLGNADIFSITKLFFKILTWKADAIICHSGRALLLARMARTFLKIPIIAVNHGSNVKKFLKADYVFNVNSFFNNELIKLGKPKDRCFVVPNMLEVSKDFSLPENKWHNPVRLGTLGRIAGEKNYHMVLKAMAILKSKGTQVEFWIGGEGNRKSQLELLSKELDLEENIKFLGWVTDKKSFFAEIDIFVLPSLTETFGMALLDAMLYKKPIITSNSWGPSDIIEDGIDGLIVSKDDSEKMPYLLADALLKLINDKKFAENLAKNANKKFHEKYSAEIVGKKILRIFETICG